MGMTKYLYVISVESPFREADLAAMKAEICRCFECTSISVSGGKHFTVHSPFGADKLDNVMKELSRKFRIEFKAGGKLE